MREEITEPQHWRTRPIESPSCSLRRRTAGMPLPAEVVDAAFNDDQPLTFSHRADPPEPATYPELVQRIHEQLALLEAQRSQLQKLLSESELGRS
jgi:hypothetical protein